MVSLIRKYQQPALIGITILVIVTFIWFWNGNQAGRASISGASTVAHIYGESVSDSDIRRDVHKFQVALALGLTPLIQALAGTAENQQQALENFVWNSYVFDHEADALQIFPTDDEVQDELAQVPAFQTDGRFDPTKLTDFVQNKLPAVGFSDTVIDDLLREQVRVKKVKALIGASVGITASELQNRYIEDTEQMDLSVVRLSASDLEKSINVNNSDVMGTYLMRKETYRSDEERKVTIASFELTDAQKALKGKERTDALQALGNQAWTFAQAVVEKGSDFAAQAKKFGAHVALSPLFAEADPGPDLGKIPALAPSAFKLTSDYPSSDVVEGPNGYYVLHLEQTVPSRPLTLSEATPKIVAELQKERAAQLMQTKANELRDKLVSALKTGKSFAQAAAAAGVAVETLPPFSLQDASKLDDPDKGPIVESAIALSPGQLSEFVQTQSGGLYVYMNGRQPPDKSGMARGEDDMKEQFARQEQSAAFLEWLRIRKQSARLEIVQR